jgi:hypothetical protein
VDQVEVDLKLLSSDMLRLTKQVEKLMEAMQVSNKASAIVHSRSMSSKVLEDSIMDMHRST